MRRGKKKKRKKIKRVIYVRSAPYGTRRPDRDTHFVNLDGVVAVAGIHEAGHWRIPRQLDLGRFDQHDADVVDGRRLDGRLGSGHGYVDKLTVLRRRQVADAVLGPHVKLVRGNRTQAAYRYLGVVKYLLRKGIDYIL